MTSAPRVSARPTTVDLRQAQRRTLGVLAMAQIISGIGVAVGVALSSLFVAKLSGSTAISGLAGTATVLGAALLALPTARTTGRSGRRAGLTLAYGSAVAGCVIAVVAVLLTSWPLLLAALVLIGGASAGNLSARYSATDLAPEGHAARHLSLVVWAATLGSVTGPNLAEPAADLAESLSIARDAGPFALAAVTFAVSTIIINLGLRPDPLLLARATSGASEAPGSDGVRTSLLGTLRDAWGTIRAIPAARRALGAIAVSHTAMVSIMSMTPVHLDHGHAGISVIGIVISLHIAGMYMLSPLVGWLADRIGKPPVLIAAMVLLLISAALAGTAGYGVPQITAGLFVLGLGWSFGLVAGSAMLSEAVPLDRRPAVQGLSDLTMNVCGATGALLAGAVVGAASFAALTLAIAVLVILTGLALVRVAIHRKTV
ncbi:putative MFS-type transporter YddS [Acrocarpospora phusangensis]|uniref:MFS-type transporter YddS n=1 Tax=Acrocarpospora phusangensis TaxID=1070424 RepID=A0A919UPW4_9ACTN|nr:MFS transporter [Acrocarpospora phusangensis]GIH29224.1 putative MFS-type transporter YddS [Acrocarpospora phusangensis]